MATQTQHPSSSMSSMSHLNSCFDPDIDSFLNLDQTSSYTSPIPSEAKGKAIASSSNSSVLSQSQPQQIFSGPSHQYDSYKQQTGLPAGGLANTFAVNQANGMQYASNCEGFVMPFETLNMPLSQTDDFDFAQHPSVDMSEMDLEADSPSDSLPPMFYPPSSSSQDFINPSAIGVKEESPVQNAPQIQRMYPGMHSQQAAQAKAQAQQKQQEMIRQQQQRALSGQRSLPQEPSKPQPKSAPSNDPAVEDRISRLLQQMRQNTEASNADDPSTPTANSSQMSRLKKDEEDMDEDERLLASEEGKKLSSKERRQLRNKVSARAFRSRRKEYIGQLEGEVAGKAQEVNDLKVQNRQLMEENARLTDLTRMLLSSPAFSGFLTELSNNGVPTHQPHRSQHQQAPQPQPTRKDVNPHQAQQQMHNQQVGMTMIPEQSIDFSMLDAAPSNGWNSGIDMNSYQVFAVTEVPQGPAIDSTVLSGKASNFVEPEHEPESKDFPSISQLPGLSCTEQKIQPVIEDPSVELDEEEFALFIDSPSPSNLSNISAPRDANNVFGAIPVEKALAHIDLTVVSEETVMDKDVLAEARLERFLARMNASCDRIGAIVSHL